MICLFYILKFKKNYVSPSRAGLYALHLLSLVPLVLGSGVPKSPVKIFDCWKIVFVLKDRSKVNNGTGCLLKATYCSFNMDLF